MGAFQAGTAGYFSERPGINLDGVVNPEALSALRSNKMLEYLRSERIACVADYPRILDALLFASLSPQEKILLQPLSPAEAPVHVYVVNPGKP